MSKIWVTGEASFLANGYSLWSSKRKNNVVVNSLQEEYFDYFRTLTPNVKRKEISLYDPTLKKLIQDSGAEFIIHAQSIDDVEFCDKFPEYAVEMNIEGTVKIAKIAKELSIPLIYLSDISHFKPSDQKILNPRGQELKNIYDFTRKSAEDAIEVIKKEDFIYLYIVNVFGDNDVKSPISKLVKSSLDNGYNSIEINLDPSEPNQFLYCDDFYSALDVVVGSYDANKGFPEFWLNIAPNETKTMMEVIEIIEQEELPLYEYEFKPHKDVYSNRILNNKRLKELGWSPKYTVKTGIQTMVKHLKKNG
jgi:nucleoside-diphosphate-sugar epimerase